MCKYDFSLNLKVIHFIFFFINWAHSFDFFLWFLFVFKSFARVIKTIITLCGICIKLWIIRYCLAYAQMTISRLTVKQVLVSNKSRAIYYNALYGIFSFEHGGWVTRDLRDQHAALLVVLGAVIYGTLRLRKVKTIISIEKFVLSILILDS